MPAKPPVVGIVVKLTNSSSRRLLRGISQYALPAHWHIVLQSWDDLEAEGDWEQWKSIALQGFLIDVAGEAALKLTRLGRPVVNVAAVLPSQAEVPSVGTDDLAVGRLVAEHLLLQPLSQFAYFGQFQRYYSEVRQRGYAQTLAQSGYRCATLVSDTPREIAAWVEALPKPVGIMAANDVRAARLLNACHAAGVEVAGHVALVGVDNESGICNHISPRLSSVATPTERVGWEAARMLDGMISAAARGESRRPDDLMLPPLAVEVRESSILQRIDADLAEALRLIRNDVGSIRGVDDLVSCN